MERAILSALNRSGALTIVHDQIAKMATACRDTNPGNVAVRLDRPATFSSPMLVLPG